jgi:CcmD family protein
MHWISHVLLLAQVSPDDIAREMGRLQRNFQFLSYGFAAAWIILALYVLMMVGRERRLKREISSLKAMLEERQSQKK